MRPFNLVVVFSADGQQTLFCKRRKDPFAGKLNFVGGQQESGESEVEAAYRELAEETGITAAEITLTEVMRLAYPYYDMDMLVFAGQLTCDIDLVAESNELIWLPLGQNYTDETRFAGFGNIGHILRIIQQDETHYLRKGNRR
ncbi:MAG TPA: NUDIX domain-containing protein [Bellilinea sp.]|nr:NUDIX domain-containing protein [Bellilinea sp.]